MSIPCTPEVDRPVDGSHWPNMPEPPPPPIPTTFSNSIFIEIDEIKV